MRERSGTRTEHAPRTLSILLAGTGVVAGLGLAAPPAPGTTVAPAPPPRQAATSAADSAADPHVRELDVPRVDGAAAPASAQAAPVVAALHRRDTTPFEMVGLTWRLGSAPDDLAVQVRTHAADGWSGWQEVHVHPAEGPASGEETAVRGGTEPLWVGPADGVDARVTSRSGRPPADLELALVDPGADPGATASPALASGPAPTALRVAPAVLDANAGTARATTVATRQPRVITRRQWGADPRLKSRCDSPRRANTVQMVFVHHTVGSNDYSRSDSKAIVRGIYAYHTQGRGWCDIGYNFLVDRYGRVFEGRAGGVNTPVRGAHAGDYNVRTVGVSLMGNFEKARPTRAMKRGVTRLLAWKLSSYYRYPRTRARISGESFEKISGHRDAMSTACPGRYVYRWLPRLRDRVANRAGAIETPISRKWHALRRHGTNLGQPYRGETASAAGGRKTQFNRGWVFYDDGAGAHPVRGAIYRRYRRYGQAGGKLAYPRTDVWRIHGHRGTGQSFQHGRIYRTPGHGAVAVWGRVNRRYARTGLADGRLGVPVRNQYRTRGGWAADFEHGRITWNTATGRTRVRYY